MRFQRANFLVSDLDRALVLYRDILSMKVDLIKESEEDSYSYDVFEIDRSIKLNFVLLSYENQPRVMALTELGKNSLAKASHPRRSAIVIEVADVDALLNKALKNNFKIYREEKLITHDGREGREIGILDDDGNLIVIYKIDKDNK
jgi:catechol 2,3-dioxygenase-like lactoylglutathione lyase family enzyme